MFQQIVNLFKIRIGILMAITSVVVLTITPVTQGQSIALWEIVVLALGVLIASASAGAFNQYMERDLDALMPRTSNRPFVTGAFRHNRWWLLGLFLLLAIGVVPAAFVFNTETAVYIFLGAFTYGVVYTVWLKRRTWLNIVIGGAAGSFAVLAGAAAVDPNIGPVAVIFAVVLFLWTPSHFWSLAIAIHDDYEKAGVPMLPVVMGDKVAAQVILVNTLSLVVVSILPVLFGMGWVYLFGALAGGGYFLYQNFRLVKNPTKKIAMASFFASLIQLTLLLVFSVIDVKLFS